MRVSVIIPAYNATRTIRTTLDSLAGQAGEIIVVDDGSTDGTAELVAGEYPEVVLLRQENRGVSAARNSGMAVATGDYIAFVDSDDFVAPDMFEKMVGKMERTNAEVAISNPYLFDHNSGEIRPYRNMLSFYRFSLLGGFSPLEHPGVFTFLGAWDKVYKRSFLNENNIRFPVNRNFTAPRLWRPGWL